MFGDLYVEHFFNSLFYRLDAGVTEFYHLAGIGEDDVVVIPVEIGFFVLRLVLPELVFAHQPAFQQQLYGVVQGGTAYAVLFVLHLDVKGFYIKVIFIVVDLLKYGKTLGRLAMAFVFQKLRKDILYYSLVVFINYFFAHNEAVKV